MNKEKELIIRNAKIEDAESIIRINIDGWKETYTGIFPSNILENLELKKEESIVKCKNKISEYIVCEINNKVVGFLRFGKNRKNYYDNYGEIYAIYVDYNYQRMKAGKKLLDFAFKLLRKSYKYVLISTLEDNSANIFYQKCGGKQIGTCNFKLEDNEYKENLYLFTLAINK